MAEPAGPDSTQPAKIRTPALFRPESAAQSLVALQSASLKLEHLDDSQPEVVQTSMKSAETARRRLGLFVHLMLRVFN